MSVPNWTKRQLFSKSSVKKQAKLKVQHTTNSRATKHIEFFKVYAFKGYCITFPYSPTICARKIILQNILAKVSFRTFRYEFGIFEITVSWNSDEGIGLCSVALGRCWTQRYVRSWANKEESRDQTRSEFLTHYSLGLLALNWLAGSVFAF